ncbi:hypothetical protein [Kribbella sp. C-35]|uniref:hypothetical protein n=1 Tax=Kribbella sp. C-35 TaxID=2789276 RepID=UPI00397E0C54
MAAVDLTSRPIEIFPAHSQTLADALASGQHELAQVDQVRADGAFVLFEQLEPLLSFFLLQGPGTLALGLAADLDLADRVRRNGAVPHRETKRSCEDALAGLGARHADLIPNLHDHLVDPGDGRFDQSQLANAWLEILVVLIAIRVVRSWGQRILLNLVLDLGQEQLSRNRNAIR